MDKQDIQVNDVWKYSDTKKLKVIHIKNDYVVYMWEKRGSISATSDKIDFFINNYKLIERNGKPVQEKPKNLEDRVRAEFGEYEVRMLKIENGLLMLYNWGDEYKHIEAQSMQGFAGYIYELDGFGKSNFLNDEKPVIKDINSRSEYKTIQPIEVLFYKDSK